MRPAIPRPVAAARRLRRLALGVALAAAPGCGWLSEPGHEAWQPPARAAQSADPAPRAPCAHRDAARQVFFGDLHVHTGFSMDARGWGLANGPEDAYRFARGEAIEVALEDGRRRRLQLDRPLDFAAVTDHTEWMAEVALCTTPGSPAFDTTSCRAFRGEQKLWIARLLRLEGFAARVAGVAAMFGRNDEVCGEGSARCRRALYTAWQATQAAAERFYDRSDACRFTTFHAFEYSYTPRRSKTHRNVVFRNEIVPELPLSWIDTPTPAELWSALERLCNDTGTGCEAIAIPHNSNLSNGRMFVLGYRDLELEAQRERARRRAELEPLVEIVQVKGESECRNGLHGVVGGPDELCDFEKIRDLPGAAFEDCGEEVGSGGEARRGCISRLDYARYALIEGLSEQARIGVNPYRLGFIGSSDGHSAAPGAVEESRAEAPLGRPDLETRERLEIGADELGAVVWSNPGGLVGVWAEENSREALFRAMRRREVFATSGPRIRPHVVAGWDLPRDLCERAAYVETAAALGVAMGADLPARPPGAGGPVLAVSALRDPGTETRPGGLLERIQIVKGWLGDDGAFHQAVVDVAGAAGRAGVDLDTCRPHGPGATHLCAVWEDPAFDPDRAAVYYARVVENPSCRWSTWQCLGLPAADRPDGCDDPRVPRTIQERAWTSPVWYAP